MPGEEDDLVAIDKMKIEDIAAHLVSQMLCYRTDQIGKENGKMKKNINKMYVEKNRERQNKVCSEIKRNIERIEKMLERNIDDINTLEVSIRTFKEKQKADAYSTGYIW
jgi:hypothetical protein